MSKESKLIHKLVNQNHFKVPEPKVPEPKIPVHLPSKKINLNGILLILFILFTVFFLYNCKYSTFSEEPVPYSLIAS